MTATTAVLGRSFWYYHNKQVVINKILRRIHHKANVVYCTYEVKLSLAFSKPLPFSSFLLCFAFSFDTERILIYGPKHLYDGKTSKVSQKYLEYFFCISNSKYAGFYTNVQKLKDGPR